MHIDLSQQIILHARILCRFRSFGIDLGRHDSQVHGTSVVFAFDSRHICAFSSMRVLVAARKNNDSNQKETDDIHQAENGRR